MDDRSRGPPRRSEADLAQQCPRELAGPGVACEEPLALVSIVDGALPDALSRRERAYRSHEATSGAPRRMFRRCQWLSRQKAQNRRSFTRIAVLFYPWHIHVRRKALSSLQEPDLRGYQAFLAGRILGLLLGKHQTFTYP